MKIVNIRREVQPRGDEEDGEEREDKEERGAGRGFLLGDIHKRFSAAMRTKHEKLY
jgi:hypothetical protein